MSEHYYTKNPSSGHDLREVRFTVFDAEFAFVTDAGVFSRDGIDPGTRALIESLPRLTGRALDLGCGWGASGLPVAKKNPDCELVLTDVNERAAELARENARRCGVNNARIVTGDGFESVEGGFDTIFTNPPIRAGKQKIYDLFSEAKNRLNPGGSLYVVIRKQQGAPSALKFLRERFGQAEVVDRSGGYWVIRASEETA